MSRKVICVLLFSLLMLKTVCGTDSFPSNALGQILPDGTETEYKIEIENDVYTVFKNDETFLRRVTEQSDLQQIVRTVSETDSNNKESVRTYRNSLLESRRYQSGNVIMNEKFVYKDGRLLFISVHEDIIEIESVSADEKTDENEPESSELDLPVENTDAGYDEVTETDTVETVTENEAIIEENEIAEEEKESGENVVVEEEETEKRPSDYIIFFLRSSVDGRLLGVKRFSSVSLTGDTYLFENNEIFFHLEGNLVVNESFTVNEDLSVDFVQDDISYHYSEKGILLSEKSGSREKTYLYDEEGNLASYTEKEGSISKTGTYNDGKLSHETVSDGTRITEETYFSDDGNEKILYSNFKPIARVKYESDNRRVKQIEYF